MTIWPLKVEKRKTLERVLATISDIQTVNGKTPLLHGLYIPCLLRVAGIALLVAALVQCRDLDLYHFHIVYDTVNFTA